MDKAIYFRTPHGVIEPAVKRLFCAGYTGRSSEHVEAHIAELREKGIGAPPQVPMLFPINPHLLTQSSATYVLGSNTAPEVEYVLFEHEGQVYVTVGSDHTDVVVEQKSAAMAKNLCCKSIAREAWALADVVDGWDRVTIELSFNGNCFQSGKLGELIEPDKLQTFVNTHDTVGENGRMVFSGTIGTLCDYPGDETQILITMSDPLRGRTISHEYSVTPLLEIFP